MKRTFLGYLKLVVFTSFIVIAPQLQASVVKPKVLVLISASDQLEVWRGFQEVWRLYKDLDPENITSLFVKGDPELSQKAVFDFDEGILWTKSEESWRPGILFKKVIAFEAIDELLDEFDYVLWSNASSFWDFPKFLETIQNYPRTKCYASRFETWHIHKWGEGSGYLLSKDIVREIALLTDHIISGEDEAALKLPDDIYLGDLLLKKMGLTPINWERMDFKSGLGDYQQRIHSIPNHVFQIRVKNVGPEKEDRIYSDILIHKQLLKRYYNIDYLPYEGQVAFPPQYADHM